MEYRKRISSFTDLLAWQESHKLALLVYGMTERFPDHEKFGLTSQLRRSSVSVSSNIAEGFGRSSKGDKEHFFTMATGSLYEVKSQLMLTRDLKWIDSACFDKVAAQASCRSGKSSPQAPEWLNKNS